MQKTTHTRQEFIDLFAYLADSIDPKHFDNAPVVIIRGGAASGKSLAADAFFNAFSSIRHLEGTRNAEIVASRKYSGEERPIAASLYSIVHSELSGGLVRNFMFRSGHGYGFNYEVEDLCRDFENLGKTGLIVVTGDEPSNHPNVILDINVGLHSWNNDDLERTIQIEPMCREFERCPRFLAYMRHLMYSDGTVSFKSQPDPNEWREGITPDIS